MLFDGASGGFSLCDAGPQDIDPCQEVSPSTPLQSTAFPKTSQRLHLRVNADLATGAGLDAVIGVSRGEPTGVGNLLAAVRFAPSGVIEAKNGVAYAAETPLAFEAGRVYQVDFDIDPATSTYSASLSYAWGGAFLGTVAQGYAFDPTSTTPGSIDHVGEVLSSGGGLSVCQPTIDSAP